MAASISPGDRITRLADAHTARRIPASACGGGSCAPAPSNAAIPERVLDRIREHPCYSEQAHAFYARMHIAVAPACNIQCNYCNRKFDCANESRPGVVSERLTPEQAEQRVLATAASMPNLSVVGIAGPGDALADHRRTFDAVRRLRARLPDMIVCLSTNGLALLEQVDEIRELGIHHVTVTLNALDPRIGAAIYDWVAFDGRRYRGAEAARVLIERQLAGIDALVAADVLVKINSVMIPGINDEHLVEVNREMVRRGVFLHNIMPLISDPAHGTQFGLTGQRGPTPAELTRLQDRLAGNSRVMRHCRQCRADAVGLLGQDCAPAGTAVAAPATAAPIVVDPAPRDAYRAFVLRSQEQQAQIAAEVDRRLAIVGPPEPVLIAVASKGGGRINQHFGKAGEFLVFRVSRSGIELSGIRRVDRYCRGGDGDEDVLETTLTALEGVSAVLCAKIGACPRRDLEVAGIDVDDTHGFEPIETAILRYVEGLSAGCRTTALSA